MYVLAKSVLALMIGFMASVILGLILIPWLRKLKIGQRTSIFVKAHEKKNGSFECFKDNMLIGKFYSDYELNDYLGYSIGKISSVGAKGYGDFSL